jgi:ribosome-associated protein
MGLVHKRDMKKTVHPGQAQEEQPVRLSRTQKKKAALSLQDLGERLVKLSDEQLKRIDLPGDVLAAVKTAKTIKKHNPHNRQMQYIGTLMRKHDPAPVREFLDALEQGNRKQTAKVKQNDKMTDELDGHERPTT